MAGEAENARSASNSEQSFWEKKITSSISGLSNCSTELEKKNIYFDLFIAIANGVYSYFEVKDDDCVDIDRSIEMADIVFKYIQYLKLVCCDDEPFETKKFAKLPIVTTCGVTQKEGTFPTLHNFITKNNQDLATKIDFEIMMTLAAVCTNFESNLQEVKLKMYPKLPPSLVPRYAMRQAIRRAADGTKKVTEVPATRIGTHHIHFLFFNGLTFAPERKLALLEALGPMTLAAMLLADSTESTKIKEAFIASISFLPLASAIADAIHLDKCGITRKLIEALADVLILTQDKSKNMWYFPLDFYMQVSKHIKGSGLDGEFSHSDIGMLKLYCMMGTQICWKIKGNPSTSYNLKQLIFHAIFNTSGESLDLLAQITDFKDWKYFNEISDAFRDRPKEDYIIFSPIMFKYFSKGKHENPSLPSVSQLSYEHERERHYPNFVNSLTFRLKNIFEKERSTFSRCDGVYTEENVGNPWIRCEGVGVNMKFVEDSDFCGQDNGRYFFNG